MRFVVLALEVIQGIRELEQVDRELEEVVVGVSLLLVDLLTEPQSSGQCVHLLADVDGVPVQSSLVVIVVCNTIALLEFAVHQWAHLRQLTVDGDLHFWPVPFELQQLALARVEGLESLLLVRS